jgi:hypothetical protein
MADRQKLRGALDRFEDGLGDRDLNVAEYLKLSELLDELEEDEPKEITVQWIESDAE